MGCCGVVWYPVDAVDGAHYGSISCVTDGARLEGGEGEGSAFRAGHERVDGREVDSARSEDEGAGMVQRGRADGVALVGVAQLGTEGEPVLVRYLLVSGLSENVPGRGAVRVVAGVERQRGLLRVLVNDGATEELYGADEGRVAGARRHVEVVLVHDRYVGDDGGGSSAALISPVRVVRTGAPRGRGRGQQVGEAQHTDEVGEHAEQTKGEGQERSGERGGKEGERGRRRTRM